MCRVYVGIKVMSYTLTLDVPHGAAESAETYEVSPLTQSLSGVARVPDGMDDRDLIAKAMLDKYEALS